MIPRPARASIVIAALIAGSIGLSDGRGDATPAVRAVVRPQQVRAGDRITVEIAARGLRGAGAVAFHLVFDPSLLEPVPEGFTEGAFLRQGGASTSFLASPASTGERIFVGIARLGASRGARGSGPLCRLTFRALAPGTTSVLFDRASVTSPSGGPRATRFVPARLVIGR